MRSVTWDGRVRITREYMYRIDELTEEARERAWMTWMDSQDYPWGEENSRSLEAFCKWFGVSVRDWRYGGGHYYISYDIPDWDLYKLRGERLWKYLVKHYGSDIDKTCPFTGYYMDEVLLDPIRKFIRRPDTHTTMEQLVREALWHWVYECDRDYEWYYSYERFLEEAEQLGLLFTEDGRDWDYEPGPGANVASDQEQSSKTNGE